MTKTTQNKSKPTGKRRALLLGGVITLCCIYVTMANPFAPDPTATPTTTPSPTHTPLPTSTRAPTATLTATPQPKPTDTPTATSTPRPTRTPSPTATSTPIPPPTAAPPTAAPPTAIPATAIPPTAAPPTAIPATAIPPTAAPPTAIPTPQHDYIAPGVWFCPYSFAGAAYVGSITSDKFHYPGCYHVKNIAVANLICFQDRASATNYGYVPCGSCKP